MSTQSQEFKTKNLNIRIRPTVLERLKTLALEDSRSVSQMVEILVENHEIDRFKRPRTKPKRAP